MKQITILILIILLSFIGCIFYVLKANGASELIISIINPQEYIQTDAYRVDITDDRLIYYFKD